MTPRKILIVEDELMIQRHLERIVASAGHRVVGTAATGAEALEAADREPPEIVLIDIHLPGALDGVDAARILREKHDCAIVFATAHADASTLARTEEVGASGYIVKPFSQAAVRAAISTASGGRERIRQAQERERSLTSILGNMGGGVLVTNETGTISFMNPRAADLVGWNVQEASGRDVVDVLRFAEESDTETFRGVLSRSLGGGGADVLARLEVLGREGTERAVRIEIEPILEQGGRVSGVVIELRELEGRRQTAATWGTTDRPFAEGARMLVYSHDSFGLGHLQRSLNLIRPLMARNPGISVLLVTGSAVAHRFDLPAGTDYVKLPTVRKVGSEKYESRFLSMSDSGIHSLRSNLLLRTIRDYDPNVLLVDHSPIGMNGELLPALEWLQRRGTCVRLLGLRDIIDEPRSIVKGWNEGGIYDAIRDFYDHVLVYGSQDVYDSTSLYEFPSDLVARTRYLNYVCDALEPEGASDATDDAEAPLVAVTIGGGDGGDEAVIQSYLEMLENFREEIDFRSEIIGGPLLSPERQRLYQDRARGLPVVMREFVDSTVPLFRRADLVVCTAGYNTSTQLLRNARRAIMIPRVLHRDEQLIRARRFEELGLVACMHPNTVTPARLLEEIRLCLGSTDEPLTRGRSSGNIFLDGSERMVEFCSGLQVRCPSIARAADTGAFAR